MQKSIKVENIFFSRSDLHDLRSVEGCYVKGLAEGIPVAQNNLDVAVVEELLLVLQDVLGQVFGQLERGIFLSVESNTPDLHRR